MLDQVWRGTERIGATDARADLALARSRAAEEIGALPEELRVLDGAKAGKRKLVASDGLVSEIERLVAEAR